MANATPWWEKSQSLSSLSGRSGNQTPQEGEYDKSSARNSRLKNDEVVEAARNVNQQQESEYNDISSESEYSDISFESEYSDISSEGEYGDRSTTTSFTFEESSGKGLSRADLQNACLDTYKPVFSNYADRDGCKSIVNDVDDYGSPSYAPSHFEVMGGYCRTCGRGDRGMTPGTFFADDFPALGPHKVPLEAPGARQTKYSASPMKYVEDRYFLY